MQTYENLGNVCDMPKPEKSEHLKSVLGTNRKGRGRNPLEDGNEIDEVEIPKKRMRRPSFIQGAAAKHWKRLLPLMEDHNLISEIDSDQLARYCITLSRYYEAEKHIMEEGAVVMAEMTRNRERSGRPTGAERDGDVPEIVKVYTKPIKNPWIAISEKSSAECRQYEKSMRMTNDSNPELHSKSRKKPGKPKGASRFFS